IEGFSASLALELAAFGLRVKLVEPGYCADTRFADNGAGRMAGLVTEPYAPFAARVFEGFGRLTAVTRPTDVAEAVWLAASDHSPRRRCGAGGDAVAWASSPEPAGRAAA